MGFFQELVRRTGFPMVCHDNGGMFTWGNQTARSRIASVKAWAQDPAGPVYAKAGKVLLVGGSMGGVVMYNYAKEFIAQVAAIVALIPVTDLQDLVANNRGGYASSIQTAYGVGAGNVADADNPAKNTAVLSQVPISIYHASDDPICIASTITAFAAATGAQRVDVGALGHTNDAIYYCDHEAAAAFLLANAP
jgi:predicted alpha/beta hydrolase family esterase